MEKKVAMAMNQLSSAYMFLLNFRHRQLDTINTIIVYWRNTQSKSQSALSRLGLKIKVADFFKIQYISSHHQLTLFSIVCIIQTFRTILGLTEDKAPEWRMLVKRDPAMPRLMCNKYWSASVTPLSVSELLHVETELQNDWDLLFYCWSIRI